MSDSAKYLVPVFKWGKWTGDNIDELREFWADELAARGATLSVDPNSGDLVGTNDFFSGFNIPVPVGQWRTVGAPAGPSSDEELLASYTEIPPEGLNP
jgi:hypothetical protein